MIRHWTQLATRNWTVRPLRTLGAAASITLGTAVVVWVTCSYESVRRAVEAWARAYVGLSQVTVQSPMGKYDTLPQAAVQAIRDVEGVAVANGVLMQPLTCKPVRRAELEADLAAALLWSADLPVLDLHGFDPSTEYEIRPPDPTRLTGRPLSPDDGEVCLLDKGYADEAGVGIGDSLVVYGPARQAPYVLEIVGLQERRRVARFQKGIAWVKLELLQQIADRAGRVTSIDVRLTETDQEAVARLSAEIRRVVHPIERSAAVRTVQARMKQFEFAQQQQEFILLILSCVAMLTALFIILSTLSMGMIERVVQLGLMRCVGLTGGQLAILVLVEVMPLGVFGVVSGIPLGLLLAQATVWVAPEYVGAFAVSANGVWMAAIAGLATAFAAALMPMMAALSVSPMEAARPRATGTRLQPLIVAAILAPAMLLFQQYGVIDRLERGATLFRWAPLAAVLAYLAYAVAAGPLIRLAAPVAGALMAAVMRLRLRLLQDQVGDQVWRSAGICCGLMVGLSLLVTILVVNESVTSGWRFPQQFPEAYIWSMEQMPDDAGELIAGVAGVRSLTVAAAQNALIQENLPSLLEQQLKSLISITWFLGVEPDSFFDLVRVQFHEGSLDEAKRLLKQGRHVVVAADFARARGVGKGDEIPVIIGNQRQKFRIAGVIESPGLDFAAGYFQVQTEFNIAAAGSVIGTRADLRRLYGVTGVRLALLNFDLSYPPVPEDWPPPRNAPIARQMDQKYFDTRIPRETRWRRWQEEQVLSEVRQRVGALSARSGTTRELKDEIDGELSRLTRLLAAVPGVAMLVAALGVANLMTANVAARSKQLAILRAVGATQGLVVRLVVAEAIVLGVIGSVMGLVLGIHVASNLMNLVDRMWGLPLRLTMPWGLIATAVALTIGLCILAGVLPARRAARTNIVDALRVT